MAVAPYNTDIYSAFAFLGLVVVLIPLKWNVLTWNTGGCMYIIWTAFSCLNWFINSQLFKGTAIDRAPIWCEIVTRYEMAFHAAIPACSLAINRRLYNIAAGRRSHIVVQGEKTRMVLCDLAICVGIPLLQVVAWTVVQGHRYDIYENVGCIPTLYNTWMAYPMVHMWPIIIGLVSGIYCALTIRHFLRRYNETKEFLKSGDGLTLSRYLRLMSLAAMDLILTVPLATASLILNTKGGVHPWLGWNDTHQGFNRVIQVASITWHMDPLLVTFKEFQRWIPIVCAFAFFFLFGFASEARRNYTLLINSIGKVTGIKVLKSFGVASQQPQSSKSGMPRFHKSGGSSNATDSMGAMGIEPVGMPSESFFAHVDFSALGGAEKGEDYSPTSTGPSDASLRGSPTQEKPGPFSPITTGSSRASITPSVAPGLGRERANSLESMRSVDAPRPMSISSERRSLDDARHTHNMV